MANKRIKDLSTTAAVTASDDFIAVDGATNGTRKLNGYSPTFGGNLTVSGTGGITSTAPSPLLRGSTSVLGGVPKLTLENTNIGAWNVYLSGTDGGDFKIDQDSTNKFRMALGTGNITLAGNLTVSGTGGSTFNAASVASPSSAYQANQAFRIISTTTAEVQQAFLSGGTYGYYIQVGGGSTYPLLLQPSGGNLLLGTTTDSGNGKLQLATHSTSAGGIGFGTDTALYRTAAGEVGLDALSGTSTVLGLRVAGTRKAYAYWESGTPTFTIAAEAASSSIKLLTANTLALTLDSSQNATFAGDLYGTTNLVLNATSGTNGNVYLRAKGTGYVRIDTGSGFRVETGKVNFSSLPTSSTGLSAGDLWVDTSAGNVVKRV